MYIQHNDTTSSSNQGKSPNTKMESFLQGHTLLLNAQFGQDPSTHSSVSSKTDMQIHRYMSTIPALSLTRGAQVTITYQLNNTSLIIDLY